MAARRRAGRRAGEEPVQPGLEVGETRDTPARQPELPGRPPRTRTVVHPVRERGRERRR